MSHLFDPPRILLAIMADKMNRVCRSKRSNIKLRHSMLNPPASPAESWCLLLGDYWSVSDNDADLVLDSTRDISVLVVSEQPLQVGLA